MIALGFFDGVHLGHGALLSRTRELSERLGLTPAAFTLDPHPSTLFSPTPVPQLTTLPLREELMRRMYGIEKFFVLPFNAQTSAQPWEEFVEEKLVGQYHGAYFVSGRDYRFGDRGEGTAERLAQKCRALGLGCDCVDDVVMYGRKISSTRIRTLIEAGDVFHAERMLGHPHLLPGTIVSAQRTEPNGDFAAVRIALSAEVLLPRDGVYAAWVYLGEREYPTAAVFRGGARATVEAYLAECGETLPDGAVTLGIFDRLYAEPLPPDADASAYTRFL